MTADRDPMPAGPSVRGPLILGLLALVVLLGGAGLWSVTTRISGAVIASGVIEVEQNRQVVEHPDGGVVADILVKDGDTVAAGAVLIRLDGTLIKSELTIVEGQFFELLARRGRLEAERDDASALQFSPEILAAAPGHRDIADQIDGQRRLFAARRASLANQVAQLEKRRSQIDSQSSGIAAQRRALDTQIALIRRELTDQKALLAKGLAQSSRVLALEREEARLEGQAGELDANRAEAEGRRIETDIQIASLGTQRREDAITQLRDLDYRELELAERRRALTEQVARLEVRAPVAGIVHAMQVTTPRSVLRPADPVLYLVPQDRPLVIAAQIAPIHIDEVAVGQPVSLRLPAFDSRTTPELLGQVSRISADALTDPATHAAYFRAEIELAPDQMARLAGQHLVPGMPVEVYLRTGDRSPLAYLMKPLADFFARAFRES